MKQKKLLVLTVVSVFLAGNIGSTFAFMGFNMSFFGGGSSSEGPTTEGVGFSAEQIQKTVQPQIQKVVQQQLQKVVGNNSLNKYQRTSKGHHSNVKSNLEKESQNQNEKPVSLDKAQISNIVNVKVANLIGSSPIGINGASQLIQNHLQSVVTGTIQTINSSTKNILGVNTLKSFSLGTSFNPNKVVTFGNLKTLYIGNLTLDKTLLHCSEPDSAVVGLCKNVSNLISNLKNKKKQLTINDVYRLQVYSATISKAISYVGALQKYKYGAVVLGVNGNTNTVTSVDLVRSYSQYNTNDNAVLPVEANHVSIKTYSKTPISDGNPTIALGLNNGAVVGENVYTQGNVNIPGATSYKVMTLKGLTKGCRSGYKSSFWYGYGKLGVSHNPQNLRPAGTKGIEFNFADKCYNTF